MAPSPEYDKEPKAPDKNIACATHEEVKNPLGVVSEQVDLDQKATTGATDFELEEPKYVEAAEEGPWRSGDEPAPHAKGLKDRDNKNNNLFKENKHVETLDDGQLRALLDEAITYKCPKDREGKSSLFKELLEEVEQDEQAACEAAGAGRGWGGGSARARHARPLHAQGSNSLQDLVAAALAAETAPRRRHAPVSARTLHGGSLPSGVDRSFLLSEEPMRIGGAGGGGGGPEYVATVRCVNPAPLAERRVSASDAHSATDTELLNRRSKVPMFPAMYTARTTLEIGGGSVCSGRAVTTTTASNQVRTRPPGPPTDRPLGRRALRPPAPLAPATNGGGRVPYDAPRGPAPPRKYDLEAYCRKKCSEDRNRPHAKRQRRNNDKYTFQNAKDGPHGRRDDTAVDMADIVVPSCSPQKSVKATTLASVDYCQRSDGNGNEFSTLENNDCQIVDNDHSKIAHKLPSDSDETTLSDRIIPVSGHTGETQNKDHKEQSGIGRRSSAGTSPELGSLPLCEIKIDIDGSSDDICSAINSEYIPKETRGYIKVNEPKNKEKSLGSTDIMNTGAIPKVNQNVKGSKGENLSLEQVQQSIINLKCKIKAKTEKSEVSPASSDVDKIIEETITDYIDYDVTNERDIDSEIQKRKGEGSALIAKGDANKSGEMPRTTYALVTLPVYEKTIDRSGKITELDGPRTKNDGPITTDYSKTAFVFLPLVKHSKEENVENDDKLCNLKPLNLSENAGSISKSLIPILSENESATDEILIFEPSRSESEGTNTDNRGQVDAGVPFDCITSPEVAAGCPAPAPPAAHDPKPLQLCSGYSSVASLTGLPESRSSRAEPPPAPPSPAAQVTRPQPPAHPRDVHQPRSVIASSFNGLPLARAAPADDYKKSVDENGNAVQNLPPLCSTLYGSSQHKKPRRKKSSKNDKNETIIDLNQVDGYRGDKDVTELLRFIEPDAEHGRGQRVGRLAKHRDDDKKRSTERRANHKESKVKRASSLEELSRTKLEDLTAAARPKKEAAPHTAPKSERRSWGDDARHSYYYGEGDDAGADDAPPAAPPPAGTPPASRDKKKTKSGSKSADSTPGSGASAAVGPEPQSDTAVELMDFQTVTKKRKPRKRYEDGDRDGPASDLYRKPKPASPERRRKSAPPSDKSNDSNDDMDSVHSLPADPAAERSPPVAAAGTPHASYADIARTRHNIPDLIESCNYYVDVDATPSAPPAPPDLDDEPRRCDPPPPAASSVPPAPPAAVALSDAPRRPVVEPQTYDPESYPALDFKTQRAKLKEPKLSPPNKKNDKKARAPPDSPTDERGVDGPRAPLPGEPSRAGDAAGEGGGGGGTDEAGVEGADGSPPDVVSDRRPPVILLDEAARPRDMDGVTFGFDINEQLLNGEGEGCDLVPGVPVCAGLRYLPPRPQHHTAHHHQIVNYVGAAWEDIIRGGNGKVRYFTE